MQHLHMNTGINEIFSIQFKSFAYGMVLTVSQSVIAYEYYYGDNEIS